MKKHSSNRQVSPFKDCKTFEEVVSIIRQKGEELRGRRFGIFSVSKPYVYCNKLHFNIVASYTDVRRVGVGPDRVCLWTMLTAWGVYNDFPKNTKLGKHDGSAFNTTLKSCGGHSEGKGYLNFIEIDLKHIPHLRKIVRQNEMRSAVAETYTHRSYPYTDADRAAMQAVSDLEVRAAAWREDERKKYLEKYPIINIVTGKPVASGISV